MTDKVPNTPSDPRKRLQKNDKDFLVKALEARGFEVHVRYNNHRIDAYQPGTREFICGFTWHKGTETVPGRWSFDYSMTDVFCLRDVKTVLTEVTRVRSLRTRAQDAWMAFLETKSDKRWAQYLSVMAAMFASRSTLPLAPKDDDNDGP